MEKTIFTLKEASEYSGISKSHLYKLCAKRNIEYSKPGNKLIFIKKDSIDKFLLSNTIPAKKDN